MKDDIHKCLEIYKDQSSIGLMGIMRRSEKL